MMEAWTIPYRWGGVRGAGACLLALLIACGGDLEGPALGGDGGAVGPGAGSSAMAQAGATAGRAGAGSGGSQPAAGTGGSASVAGSSGRAGGTSTAGRGGSSGSTDAGSGARDAAIGEPSGSGGSGSNLPVSTRCAVDAADAPPATWRNATGNLAGMKSECGNLTLVAADPCSEQVIAGVAHEGLWSTRDGGTTWTRLGAGAGSSAIVHRPSSIVFDPEHPEVLYETGIYGALDDGLYESADRGATMKKLGTIGHLDLVSVDFADPERKTLLAGVHETKQKLFLSTDAGASWNDIGSKLPAGSHFSSAPLVLDAKRFLLGACGWGDGTCGVFASNDGGQSWQQTSKESPAGQPLWTRDGHLIWPAIWGSGALLSDDAGQTWTKVSGPRSTPVELPDGRIVAVGGDHLIISGDHGASWQNVGEPLPFPAAGVSYSPAARSFFIWHNDCGDAVLADAVMSAGFAG